MEPWLNCSNLEDNMNQSEFQQSITYTELGVEGYVSNNDILSPDKVIIASKSSKDETNMSSLLLPTLSNDEILNMWNILKSWNLECVYQTCVGKNT